jgi:hypothetical protein
MGIGRALGSIEVIVFFEMSSEEQRIKHIATMSKIGLDLIISKKINDK